MKTILLQNPISFKDLKVKYGIEKYTFVNGCIGYNEENACIVTRDGNLHRNYTDWEEL